MPLDPAAAAQFVADRHKGVLVTIRASDGRPQLSNVMYAADDGRLRVSVTTTRAKTVNARRDPRVSMHVTSDDFWTYVVAEGTAELSPVAAQPGDRVTEDLLALYEAIRGEPHPDPDEFRTAMIDEGRLVMTVHVERYYPTT